MAQREQCQSWHCALRQLWPVVLSWLPSPLSLPRGQRGAGSPAGASHHKSNTYLQEKRLCAVTYSRTGTALTRCSWTQSSRSGKLKQGLVRSTVDAPLGFKLDPQPLSTLCAGLER